MPSAASSEEKTKTHEQLAPDVLAAASPAEAKVAPGDRGPLFDLYIAGAAMLSITAFFIALGSPPWFACINGAIIFSAIFGLKHAQRCAKQARRREAAKEIGLDPGDLHYLLSAARSDIAALTATASRFTAPDKAFRGVDEPLRDLAAQAREVTNLVADAPQKLPITRNFFEELLPTARAHVERYEQGERPSPAEDAHFRKAINELTDHMAMMANQLRREGARSA